MTCSRCHEDWCWVCQRRLYRKGCGKLLPQCNYSMHYEPFNVFGCPNMQFAASYPLWRRQLLYAARLWGLTIGLPMLTVAMLWGLTTCLATLFGCSCCCFVLMKKNRADGREVLMVMSGWTIALVMGSSVATVALGTCCLLWPCLCTCLRRKFKNRWDNDRGELVRSAKPNLKQGCVSHCRSGLSCMRWRRTCTSPAS